VWSYEVGTKNKLLENRMLLDASVYYIKWKNIQTSLFLQNCAESFTNNIAQANSRGFDVGLQFNPVGSLSVTGSVGYNKSTFASDGNSPGGVLIVRKDGVIPGSPAPWVYSVSTQYDFHVFDARKLYVRADFTHSSTERRVGQTDPNNPNFNPDLEPIAAYSVLNLRLGTTVAGAEVALFVNNVTGQDPDLAALNNSPLSGFKRYIWSDATLRPRTYGLFASYRY
jgi:outer membrane receptor protein involved in Fe transport